MLLYERRRRNLCHTKHSRLYIHLQPLQAAQNSLVAFDPSIQLFMEVVEVPKPFCIRHNFNWWAQMLLRESEKYPRHLKYNMVGVPMYQLRVFLSKGNVWKYSIFRISFLFIFASIYTLSSIQTCSVQVTERPFLLNLTLFIRLAQCYSLQLKVTWNVAYM